MRKGGEGRGKGEGGPHLLEGGRWKREGGRGKEKGEGGRGRKTCFMSAGLKDIGEGLSRGRGDLVHLRKEE